MKGNFERCLAHVLKSEGGYVDHPRDPGGATNMGITLKTYRSRYGSGLSKDDLKQIPMTRVHEIYFEQYWNKCRCNDLPAGVDLVVFDAAVNSGPRRSIKWLQESVRVAQDGLIGKATLVAVHDELPQVTVAICLDSREAFLTGLSTFSTFGKGWMNRLASVEKEAYAMIDGELVEPGSEDGSYKLDNDDFGVLKKLILDNLEEHIDNAIEELKERIS